MPFEFGLTKAPATFRKLMEKKPKPALGNMCTVYIHDFIVFSQSEEEHVQRVQEIVSSVQQAGRRFKIENAILQLNTYNSRVRLHHKGLKPQQYKCDAILDAVIPHTAKRIMHILGPIKHLNGK